MGLRVIEATSCETISYNDSSEQKPVRFQLLSNSNTLDFSPSFTPPTQIGSAIFDIKGDLMVTNVEKFALQISPSINTWLLNMLGAESLQIISPGIVQDVILKLNTLRIPTVLFLKPLLVEYTVAGEKRIFTFSTRLIK